MLERGWRTTLYGTAETVKLAAHDRQFSRSIVLEPADVRRAGALGIGHTLVVIDHYDLDAQYEMQSRHRAGAVLSFSDHPSRSHACDLLLDQNLGRAVADYAGLVEAGCTVLTGSEYVLLRPIYRRFDRLGASRVRETARNLVVTFGASDPDDVTGRVLRHLRGAPPQWRIRVVLGPSYAHTAAIERLASDWPALQVVYAPRDLVDLMQWADAALTAAGGTCWELCYMALPFAVVAFGATPNTNAQRLAECNAAIDLGTAEAITESKLMNALNALMGAAAERRAMAAAASALIDGRGAHRVCDIIKRRQCQS